MPRKARAGVPENLDNIIGSLPAVQPPTENDAPATVATAPMLEPTGVPQPTVSPLGAPADLGILGAAPSHTPGAPAGGPQTSTPTSDVSGRPVTAGPSAGSPGVSAELDLLKRQLELQGRELAFLRAREQPQAAAQPTPQQVQQGQQLDATAITVENILPFIVRGADVQTLLEDPEAGAQMLDGALRAMGMHIANLVLNRAAALYQVVRAAEQQTQANDYEQRLRVQFWSQNADLQAHQNILQGFIQQCWNEGLRVPEQLLTEAARRSRQFLGLPNAQVQAAAGAPFQPPAYQPAQAAPFRPATAEMGGASAPMANGAIKPDDVQSMLLQMAAHH